MDDDSLFVVEIWVDGANSPTLEWKGSWADQIGELEKTETELGLAALLGLADSPFADFVSPGYNPWCRFGFFPS